MFNRGGTHSKLEVTAPPVDVANKLKLQYPPPALLLQEHQYSNHISSKSRPLKYPVYRQRSQPIIEAEEKIKNASINANRVQSPSTNVHDQIYDKRKKKTVFSFLKKKEKDEEELPPRRAMARTPDSIGRKQIQYDDPGSAPSIRRPHSVTSDRQNGVKAPRRHKGNLDSEDEDVDEPLKTVHPRFKPARVAPPIPIHAMKPQRSQNGGYDSLEKYQRMKNMSQTVSSSQSDEGSLNHSSYSDPLPSSSVSQGTVGTSVCPNLPGLTGIKNHGNTCFINAVIQCLSSSEPLLKFFLTGMYQNDLATSKRARSAPSNQTTGAPSGSVIIPDGEGAITESIGMLIRSLWNGQYEVKVSSFVREVIGVWSEEFRGRKQHDAQEFLLWLLDHLHEDLNRATGQRMTRVRVCVCVCVLCDQSHVF